MITRKEMASRAAKELLNGDIVNLGIGMPTMVLDYVPDNVEVMFQSENGILGMSNLLNPENEDPDLIDAGKKTISHVDGASVFSSLSSFEMIRGNHIDIAILGAMQVSCKGDIANWMIPGKMIKGMGGAMDLATGAKKIIVLMDHCARDNTPKLLQDCTLPLTGSNCVDMVITNMGVFEIFEGKNFKLIEIAKDTTLDNVKKYTGANFIISEKLTHIKV
jgi:3-oxoacid CoA-transferase B subunit